MDVPKPYRHLTAAHKVLLWPTIYVHLLNSGIAAATDLQYVLQEGTPWFINLEMAKYPQSLPYDVCLPCYALRDNQPGQAARVAFPSLSSEYMQQYSEVYFDTFNVIYPILNRDNFRNETIPAIQRHGYGDGDPASIIALLVFALGKVGMEGIYGDPISFNNNCASGIRGGSYERPPGLEIFNEARRRIGLRTQDSGLRTATAKGGMERGAWSVERGAWSVEREGTRAVTPAPSTGILKSKQASRLR
ncbi:hypothetical protein LTR28_004386 [Elasticomyces elasticus]|nr:hypothetical protein LTR28_004386 [Elasticomyces elasticus]